MVPNILTQIFLFSINHLFAFSEMVSNIANINSFIRIQLNGFKHDYVTLIQFRHTIKNVQVEEKGITPLHR